MRGKGGLCETLYGDTESCLTRFFGELQINRGKGVVGRRLCFPVRIQLFTTVTQQGNKSGIMAWQTFALMTVLSWGVYGVLLHTGRMGMLKAGDAANASMKAFLWVGIAYFVVAIVGPVIILLKNGSNWSFTKPGVSWSFIAGVAGAVGAFTLILALGAAAKAGASTANVMSLVFAGAPVVNALVAMSIHPPEGGLKTVPMAFWLGIVLAASGGYLVSSTNPNAQVPAKSPASATKH